MPPNLRIFAVEQGTISRNASETSERWVAWVSFLRELATGIADKSIENTQKNRPVCH